MYLKTTVAMHMKGLGGEGIGFESDFDEKIDVIDLIINVLKDHEKKLDELVSRLESTGTVKLSTDERDGTPDEKTPIIARPSVTVKLKRWPDFLKEAKSAELVAYNTGDGVFSVSALVAGTLYKYAEPIPSMDVTYRSEEGKIRIDGIDVASVDILPAAFRGRLDCGLELNKNSREASLANGATVRNIRYEADVEVARSWIAYQLGIDDDLVILGEILF